MFTSRKPPFRVKNRDTRRRDVRPLQLESLEERVTPADLFLKSWSASSAAVGSLTSVHLTIGGSGFPLDFDTDWEVRVTINNISKTSNDLHQGLGGLSSFNKDVTLGDWLVEPNFGANQVRIEIDPFNHVAETNEGDNIRDEQILGVHFDSAFAPGQKLNTPIAGTPFKHWNISNYVDLNSGPGATDYRGKSRTYDTNNGLDFKIKNFASMDNGVPVMAAADGIVSDVYDGEFDRNEVSCPDIPSGEPHPQANYVTIDHGNGWKTTYARLRKNSVAVSVGDLVKAGDDIGLVGASGCSNGPNLHFVVTYNGTPVETYVDPSGYWLNPLPYAGNLPNYSLVDFADHYITENSGVATITVVRPGSAATLQYATQQNSARGGHDFIGTSGTIDFLPFEFVKTVTVPIINDDVHESAESFKISFSRPGGSNFSQSWTIIDDDATFNYVDGANPIGTFTVNGGETAALAANDLISLDIVLIPDYVPNVGYVPHPRFKATVNGQARILPRDFPVSRTVINGGDGDDTIDIRSWDSDSTVIDAGDGNDTIKIRQMFGATHVAGRDGNDTITVGAGSLSQLVGDVTVDGGTGQNTLNLDDRNERFVSERNYSIHSNFVFRSGMAGNIFYTDTIQKINLTSAWTADTFTVFSSSPDTKFNINAGGGNDTLVGPDAANLWTVGGVNSGTCIDGSIAFASIENLTGGTDEDTIQFQPSGSISGSLKGGSGVDTLEYKRKTAVTVNLAASKATSVGGTFSELEAAVGGNTSLDQLIGANVDQFWTVSGPDVVRVGSFSATAFENLLGGNQADQFRFIFNCKVTGKIDGSAGTDTINYSKYGSAIKVDLATKTYSLVGKAVHIEAVVGSSFSDTLLGVGLSSGVNLWSITGTNAGHFHSANADLDFAGIENLTGYTNSDLFELSDGGSVAGMIDGNGAGDILAYETYSNPVTVNLATSSATATGGIASIEFLFGGLESDTLIARPKPNSWKITANNAGKINGNEFTFTSIENLSGNTQADSFVFAKGQGVSGTIDGGGGVDTLDYSAYVTTVNVDLTLGIATGTAGVISFENAIGGAADDKLIGNSVDNFLNGNGGADLLFGLNGADILLGAAGDDSLDGGDGNDFLIGGIQVDKLVGGNGDDILVGGDLLLGGIISYASNGVGLDLMRTNWKRTDLNYDQRVDLLRNTGVNGGQYKLNSNNVVDDVTADSLTGGANQDWFWGGAAGPGQDGMDNVAGEQVN